MELIQEKNSRTGIIGTIAVHLLLLLLFIQFGMPYQDPPPVNEGAMMINFGTSDEGLGEIQPEEATNSSSENTTPSENSAAEEHVLTQDSPEAVAVNSSETQSSETATQEEPVVSENLSNALNALNNSENSTNQGDNGESGDQGDPNGDPNSHGNSLNSGIGFDLGGRGKVSFKKPDNPTQEDGKVVVAIVVDKYGKVIKATPGARGSTTTNLILYKKAKEAALLAKFTSKLEVPTDQKGTMTFVFILN